jgi:YVTN family beta-propeller protein
LVKILASKAPKFKVGRMQWVILLILMPLLVQIAPPPPSIPSKTLSSSNLRSSAITVTVDGQLVLAVNPDSNTLSVVDASAKSLLAEVPVGANPQSVTVSASGALAYVANKDADTVSVVDLLSLTEIEELRVGDRPAGVTISPDGQFLAVAELGDDKVRFVHCTEHLILYPSFRWEIALMA